MTNADILMQKALQLLQPVLACRDWAPVERIGEEKFVCNVAELSHSCLVFRLGGVSMITLSKTRSCNRHPVRSIPSTVSRSHSVDNTRHVYHKQCIGSDAQAAA